MGGVAHWRGILIIVAEPASPLLPLGLDNTGVDGADLPPPPTLTRPVCTGLEMAPPVPCVAQASLSPVIDKLMLCRLFADGNMGPLLRV